MIAISDRSALLAAIDHAHSVRLAAYVLPPVVTARLAAAARRGARVELALTKYPVGDTADVRRDLADGNRAAAAAVRRAGGRAELLSPRDPLHMKAALVDDRIAYLDDRNWSDDGPQTILADDDPADVAVVRDAFARLPAGDGDLQTLKPRSLALECDVVESAGRGPLGVESESFGDGPVCSALERRAAAGLPTRLLVCSREVDAARARAAAAPASRLPSELAALDRLAAGGVDVRVTDAGEKLAVAPDAAWVGSANATRDWGSTARQLDWGKRVVDPPLVAALAERFERNWSSGAPYAPGSPQVQCL